MATSKVYTAQLSGLTMETISVEVDISNGLHAFSIVGLGDRAVAEARDRISAAIKNSGFTSPKQKNQKVVISLAPADIRKEGPSFDLAMALAYLAAANEITIDPAGIIFLGELSLDGSIRKVTGALPILCQAPAQGFSTAFVPRDNAKEASLAQGICIYAVNSIKEILSHLSGQHLLTPIDPIDPSTITTFTHSPYDISAIRGNEVAKRGLEIAAAGAHNIVLCGPPGTGKSMLAQSFASILPDLTYDQAVEVTGIHSAARTLSDQLITRPPFRSPHHTSSYPAIIGGGSFPRPGEITLAHRGVLFLDEFPEFDRDVIEALRQPLEDRVVTISRARGSVTFPAHCMLVAAMNPCPCGLGKSNGCTCTERIYDSYRRKMSRPVTDRIDIWISVSKVDYDALAARTASGTTSSDILVRVSAARARQRQRFEKAQLMITTNSEMSAAHIQSCVNMHDDARSCLKIYAENTKLSGRAFHRVIKVAQTIADLDCSETINRSHMLEALQYRDKGQTTTEA